MSAVRSTAHLVAHYMSHQIKDVVGKAEHHVKDPEDFINNIKEIQLQPDDILVSFDVVVIHKSTNQDRFRRTSSKVYHRR